MDKGVRASRAEAILNNELFNDAFESIKTDLVNGLSKGYSDKAKQDCAVLSLQLLDRIRMQFISHINTGKLDEKTVRDKKKFRIMGV